MEKKTKKTKQAAPKKAPKKTVKKTKEISNEALEINEIVQEQSHISSPDIRTEIVDATKKSEKFWGKLISLFKDNIFLTFLIALSFSITIILYVENKISTQNLDVKVPIKDSIVKKTDTVFIESPKSAYRIKELEHELEFTRENYMKAVKMLESR
jgi:hypothetical protein